MEGGGGGADAQQLEIGGTGGGASQRMHSQDPASITGRAGGQGADSLAEMKRRRKE
jgi:hypothetical protein